MRLLHVYGQQVEHDDVVIVGNNEGLVALRNAIDDVLKNQDEDITNASHFANDGEGYDTIIVRNDKPASDRQWTQLESQYTSGTSYRPNTEDTITLCSLLQGKLTKQSRRISL